MSQPLNFGFGMEEQMLKAEARKFFRKRWNEEKLTARLCSRPDLREGPACHWEEKAWREAIELGWASLAVPKRAQGTEISAVGAAALVEEAGRAAFASPLLANICSSYLLCACGTEAADRMLCKISVGHCASLAIMDRTGSWKNAACAINATQHDDIRLNGTAWFVQDARKVDHFVVRCLFEEGEGLVVVPISAEGVVLVPDAIVNLTCDQAHIDFKNTPVRPDWIVASPGAAGRAIEKAEPAIFTMMAADMVGAAEWQLQTTAAYAKQRVQFDRPIGFFQAVKHPIVNMMLMIDEAKSLVYNAACAIDHEPEESLSFAHMAKSSAGDMAFFCSDRSVQLHGGMGFTWESPVHIYFKRQSHHRVLFGDSRYHRARLAEMMIAEPE